MTITLGLLLMHFIGDFALQSDWMATYKSKRLDALALHCGIYALCFVPWGLPFVAITFVAHAVTDAVTSRATAALWFFRREDGIWTQAEYAVPTHGRTLVNPWTPVEGKRHWFFVVIGADQLLHFAQLALTVSVLG